MKQSKSILRKLGREEEKLAGENQKPEQPPKQEKRRWQGGHRQNNPTLHKECEICEAKFSTGIKRKRFCSPRCSEKYHSLSAHGAIERYDKKTGRVSPLIKKCDVCGNEFETYTKKKKFCSKECWKAAQRVAHFKHRTKPYISPMKYLTQRWRDIKMQCAKGRRHGSIKFTLGKQDLQRKWEEQKGICALTGLPMTHIWKGGFVGSNISVDRIENDKPYSNSNTRLVCRIANHMKFQMTDSELLTICRAMVKTLENKAAALGLLDLDNWRNEA